MAMYCRMALFLPFLLALGGLLNQFREIFFYYFPGWFFSQCSLFFSFYHLEFGSPRLILSFSYLFSPISHFFFIFKFFDSIYGLCIIQCYLSFASLLSYVIFISNNSLFALKTLIKKTIVYFCFMVLIPSFDSLRILMIFFFFFLMHSLLCIHFYSKLFFLFDYFDLSFSCWLFFLRCLVLLSCFIFKSGGWKALIGNSETMREVNHLCALL